MAVSLLAAIRFFLLLLLLSSSSLWRVALSDQYRNPVCYPLEPFCLFTPPDGEAVNSIGDAASRCQRASGASYPFAPSGVARLRLLAEYVDGVKHLSNASIIMDAMKRESDWICVNENDQEVTLDASTTALMKESDAMLFFQSDPSRDVAIPYSVVCVMDCLSRSSEHENKTRADGLRLHNVTRHACMLACEKFDCLGWSWSDGPEDGEDCTLHNRSDSAALLDAPGVVYTQLDRSTKTVQICLPGAVVEDSRPETVGPIRDDVEQIPVARRDDPTPESSETGLSVSSEFKVVQYDDETPPAGPIEILITRAARKIKTFGRKFKTTPQPVQASYVAAMLVPPLLMLMAALIIGVWYFMHDTKRQKGSVKASEASSVLGA